METGRQGEFATIHLPKAFYKLNYKFNDLQSGIANAAKPYAPFRVDSYSSTICRRYSKMQSFALNYSHYNLDGLDYLVKNDETSCSTTEKQQMFLIIHYSALGILKCALCSLPFALCLRPSPFALCPSLFALRSLPFALPHKNILSFHRSAVA